MRHITIWICLFLIMLPSVSSGAFSSLYMMDTDGSNLRQLVDFRTVFGDSLPEYAWCGRKPLWSPRGEKLLISLSTSWGVRTAIVEVGSGKVDFILTELGSVFGVQWVEKGKRLLFGHRYDIFVANADGSDPRNLTQTTGEEYSPAVSPRDNNAYYALDTELLRIDLNGKNRKVVAKRDGGQYMGITFSPDGAKLVYQPFGVECGGPLVLLDLHRMEEVQFTEDASSPQWSPDGSMIAYVGDSSYLTEAEAHIRIYDTKRDSTRRLVELSGEQRHFDWSPDSRFVVLSSRTREDPGDVYIVNVDGSGLRRLTSNPHADTWVLFSRDGKRILFIRDD